MNVAGHELMNPNKSQDSLSDEQADNDFQLNLNKQLNFNTDPQRQTLKNFNQAANNSNLVVEQVQSI